MAERWKHKETGRIYKVQARGQMKTADGEWIPSVIYTPEEIQVNYIWFTRDKETFEKKFERV